MNLTAIFWPQFQNLKQTHMNKHKHKGNSIKNVKQKTQTNKKKNDENQIKNANPNREKREKRAIENFYLFTKSCQHFFSNTKLLTLEVGNQKHPGPFFLWDIVLLLPEN